MQNSATTKTSIISELGLQLPSPMQAIEWPLDSSYSGNIAQTLNVFVKRDDLIHAQISGNKWRKLAPIVEQMQKQQYKRVISFGGGYSNHLHALAYVCKILKIHLVAIVRGDYSHNLSPMLSDIQAWGAEIVFINKIQYKLRSDAHYCAELQTKYAADLIIPEGGSHKDSIQGLQPLVNECLQAIPALNHIVVPVASGATLAGISSALYKLNHHGKVIGIAALKGQGYLEQLVCELLPNSISDNHSANQTSNNILKTDTLNWHIEHTFVHGGYAKSSPQLAQFMENFEHSTHIELEPVYSGKCFYAVDQLVRADFFPANSQIIVVHTGGLQGKRHIN